jgi:hypothetical protein
MKIIFNSNRHYNNKDLAPSPTKKTMPSWFKNASKYWKDFEGNDLVVPPDNKKGPGFKSCPALHDIFTTGYTFTTPCDINVFIENGYTLVRAEPGYDDFVAIRSHMGEFHYPEGYYKFVYHWYPNWGFTLPEGYSALIVQPINNFELPFLTVGGIIDSDKYGPPGLMPFFIRDGFKGIIPKGTPYAQIIPIKREEWKSEFNLYTYQEMQKKHDDHVAIYRADTGVYKKITWVPKKYE